MQQWNQLVRTILNEGEVRGDRTGVGTIAINEYNMRFDLREAFPLVTSKETRYAAAFLEMLWFLRGEGDTKWLHQHGSKLWDAWADKDGNLGPIYGVQWRRWARNYETAAADGSILQQTTPVDQVAELIQGLRNNPHGRRHLVTAWNVADVPRMGLPPCHWGHRCYVTNKGELDLTVYIRSSDVALGLPFNIAQYALLTHLYARAAGLTVRCLNVNLGDTHIYENHIEAMRDVVERPPVLCTAQLAIKTDNIDIDGYKPEDFSIENYVSYPFVPLPVAV